VHYTHRDDDLLLEKCQNVTVNTYITHRHESETPSRTTQMNRLMTSAVHTHRWDTSWKQDIC